MKTPYRYLIGISVGVLAGLLLPSGQQVADLINLGAELSLLLGRYLVLPLIFFTLPVAVTQLRRGGQLGTLLLRAGILVLISSAVLAVLGTLSAWFPEFGRIPVIPSTYTGEQPVKFLEMIRGILQGNSKIVLTLLVPAFILGWHFHHDREIAEPSYNVFDSLSRILYRAECFFLLLMPVMLAFLSASAVMQTRLVTDFQRFWGLLGMLYGLCLVLAAAVYPLILRLTGSSLKPWKDLAGLSGALAGALVSGSPLFNYGNLVLHLKENLNIPRKNAGLTAPVYLLFARGGTAFIAAFSMLT
ncbi:MAG: hypothetical protein CSA76_06590, partial [Spirochaetales bacterium]